MFGHEHISEYYELIMAPSTRNHPDSCRHVQSSHASLGFCLRSMRHFSYPGQVPLLLVALRLVLAAGCPHFSLSSNIRVQGAPFLATLREVGPLTAGF